MMISSCQQARSLWLAATRPDELVQVEHLYRQVWEDQHDDDQSNESPNDSKKRRRLQLDSTCKDATEDDDDSSNSKSCVRQQAGERLAMLLLQSGRTNEADDILKRLSSFTCRLSTSILAYSDTVRQFHSNSSSSSSSLRNNIKTSLSSTSADIPPCRIYDDFLSAKELEHLQGVFADPSSSYWTTHDYAVEPPSPYFSHLVPLDDDLERNFGRLGTIIRRIQTILTTTTTTSNSDDQNVAQPPPPFAPLVKRCAHVEMWAHNRPHATGHQLHFDSDNEGQGSGIIRHPVVSCILYLSSSDQASTLSSTSSSTLTCTSSHHYKTGGCFMSPSLITNQRRVSRRAADKGWLIEPKLRRLAVFDGRVLHGVIPGQGVLAFDETGINKNSSSSSSSNNAVGQEDSKKSSARTTTPEEPRRVTLMLAFWRHIQVREPQTSSNNNTNSTNSTTTCTRNGAAQRFPMNSSSSSTTESEASSSTDSCWAWQLRQPPPSSTEDDNNNINNEPNDDSGTSHKPTLAEPIPLDHVYETLDGQPWTHKLGMPDYNEVFQGF